MTYPIFPDPASPKKGYPPSETRLCECCFPSNKVVNAAKVLNTESPPIGQNSKESNIHLQEDSSRNIYFQTSADGAKTVVRLDLPDS